MPEGNVLTAKVGPLPLVVWVIGGSSVVFVLMLMRNKGNAGAQGVQTNQVSALAPTEAEAFGTMEQQQQDVVNALTTLGNNQSALGGSMSTLTGIVTQQGADNAAAFQNLQNGQSSIEQGQQSAASASSNYYNSLLSNLTNYFNSLQGSVNGVNSNVTAQGQANQSAIGTALQWISNVSGQVTNVQQQQQADSAAQNWGFANMDALLAYMFYQIPNRYQAYFPASVNAGTNLPGAEAAVPGGGIATAQPGWSTRPT